MLQAVHYTLLPPWISLYSAAPLDFTVLCCPPGFHYTLLPPWILLHSAAPLDFTILCCPPGFHYTLLPPWISLPRTSVFRYILSTFLFMFCWCSANYSIPQYTIIYHCIPQYTTVYHNIPQYTWLHYAGPDKRPLELLQRWKSVGFLAI